METSDKDGFSRVRNDIERRKRRWASARALERVRERAEEPEHRQTERLAKAVSRERLGMCALHNSSISDQACVSLLGMCALHNNSISN